MSAARPLPEALLMDYAAGTASRAISLLMATHLAMSSESRALFALMQTVGGALLEDLEDEPLERISAEGTLALAEMEGSEPVLDPFPGESASAQTFHKDSLPAPVRLAEAATGGDLRWRRLGIGVAATKLAISSESERAHLLWAKGGTGIATHRHVGREVVLVLKGAFWDDGVLYEPGDVAVSEDGTIHAPRIHKGDDCVCLAVTEAPVHFSGLPGIILNRFCRF